MLESPVLIGVIGTICSMLFAYAGYRKGLKVDAYKEGNDDGTLKTDMQYIKRRVDDVLFEQKDLGRCVNNLTERVVRVEESSKQAHKRIDQFQKEHSYK